MKKIRLHQRLEKIVEQLGARGGSSYDELQKILGVSGMMVRRDVNALVLSGRAINTLQIKQQFVRQSGRVGTLLNPTLRGDSLYRLKYLSDF